MALPALVPNLPTRWCHYLVTKFVPNSSYRSNAWVRCASGNVFFWKSNWRLSKVSRSSLKLSLCIDGQLWWSNMELMQLVPSGGQIWNQSKWCTRWPNWQPMQVAPSGGQICNQFKKFHWNQFQTILVERFTQVMDSIPWVRCASGNVFCHTWKMSFLTAGKSRQSCPNWGVGGNAQIEKFL